MSWVRCLRCGSSCDYGEVLDCQDCGDSLRVPSPRPVRKRPPQVVRESRGDSRSSLIILAVIAVLLGIGLLMMFFKMGDIETAQGGRIPVAPWAIGTFMIVGVVIVIASTAKKDSKFGKEIAKALVGLLFGGCIIVGGLLGLILLIESVCKR